MNVKSKGGILKAYCILLAAPTVILKLIASSLRHYQSLGNFPEIILDILQDMQRACALYRGVLTERHAAQQWSQWQSLWCQLQ